MTTIFVISAPSGSGKSTLVARLLHLDPRLRFSVSYTTRKPRGHEKPGESYVYISREEFEERIKRNEFLEYAEVFGNYYGTNRETFESATHQGQDLVLDIDVQGARQLKVAIPQAISIFVLPPSRDVLEQRLRSRSQDSEEVIQRRLRGAAKEVQNYTQYDFVLINRDIEEASARLASIVKAERLRKARMEEEVRPILESFEGELPEQDKEDDEKD